MGKIEELCNAFKETIMLCSNNEDYTELKIKELITYVNNYDGFLSAKELKSSLFVITRLTNSDYNFDDFSFEELFKKIEEYYGSTEYERVKNTTDYFLDKCQN